MWLKCVHHTAWARLLETLHHRLAALSSSPRATTSIIFALSHHFTLSHHHVPASSLAQHSIILLPPTPTPLTILPAQLTISYPNRYLRLLSLECLCWGKGSIGSRQPHAIILRGATCPMAPPTSEFTVWWASHQMARTQSEEVSSQNQEGGFLFLCARLISGHQIPTGQWLTELMLNLDLNTRGWNVYLDIVPYMCNIMSVLYINTI